MYERERDSKINVLNNQIVHNVIKQLINMRLLLRVTYVLLTNYITSFILFLFNVILFT